MPKMLIKAQPMPNNLSDLYYIWRLKINRQFNSMQKKEWLMFSINLSLKTQILFLLGSCVRFKVELHEISYLHLLAHPHSCKHQSFLIFCFSYTSFLAEVAMWALPGPGQAGYSSPILKRAMWSNLGECAGRWVRKRAAASTQQVAKSRRSQSHLEKTHLELGQKVPLFTQMAVGKPVHAVIWAGYVSPAPGSHMAMSGSGYAQANTLMQLCNRQSLLTLREACIAPSERWLEWCLETPKCQRRRQKFLLQKHLFFFKFFVWTPSDTLPYFPAPLTELK